MTLVLDGTNNTYLSATERGQLMTLSTAQATTSGTSIDFTNIPTWAKKITVMFSGVSTNGTSRVQIQLGTSAGFEITGYTGSDNAAGGAFSSGFTMAGTTAADTRAGSYTLNLLSTGIWTGTNITWTASTFTFFAAGSKTLSTGGNVLTQIRFTTANGTDTFDGGSVNILIEGSL